MGNSFLSGKKHEKTENMRYGDVFGRAAIVSNSLLELKKELSGSGSQMLPCWIMALQREKPMKNNIV